MKFSDFVPEIQEIIGKSFFASDPEILMVSNDSRKVVPGTLFVSIGGSSGKGGIFISDALKKGAAAIVSDSQPINIPPEIPFLQVGDAYGAYSRICELFFEKPAEKLSLIAVTGTNGKTSTAFLTRAIFSFCSVKIGLLSTVWRDDGAESVPADRTTPDAFELQDSFRRMLANSCTHAVMEVSSHALVQNRIGNAKFAAAAFTNLSGDHLDYHRTMEEYFRAKKILFEKHLKADSVVAVNMDDAYGPLIKPACGIDCGYGRSKNAAYRISDVELSPSGSAYLISFPGGVRKIATPLVGEYNVHNTAAAFAIAHGLGLPPDAIAECLAQKIRIPGRMDKIVCSDGPMIVIDYAHTDDALERVIRALRPACRGKLICVFGCGGDRDRTKRPRMGAVSAKFADFTIISSDNPRSEDPATIAGEIFAGLPPGAPSTTIIDRSSAILEAVSSATDGDIVLIAGKGHEDYQEIAGVKRHFDDIEEALAACRSLGLEVKESCR